MSVRPRLLAAAPAGPPRVVVVGGGASGTLVALATLRAILNAAVTVVEPAFAARPWARLLDARSAAPAERAGGQHECTARRPRALPALGGHPPPVGVAALVRSPADLRPLPRRRQPPRGRGPGAGSRAAACRGIRHRDRSCRRRLAGAARGRRRPGRRRRGPGARVRVAVAAGGSTPGGARASGLHRRSLAAGGARCHRRRCALSGCRPDRGRCRPGAGRRRS